MQQRIYAGMLVNGQPEADFFRKAADGNRQSGIVNRN